MQAMRLGVMVLGLVGLMAALARGNGNTPVNTLEIRQCQVETRRGVSSRQVLHCWQVLRGSWDGQGLEGLAAVLVRPVGADGRASGQAVLYVSEFATLAQREALLAALAASCPEQLPGVHSAAVRVEPAVIELEELGGQTFVLHLGLIAMGPRDGAVLVV